jgi:hypothetical protein
MTIAETLLAERREDLREDASPGRAGSVRDTVAFLLRMADGALYADEYEHADVLTASGNVDAAIRLLTVYRARLERLNTLEDAEAFVAAGYTRNERGGYWTKPATRDA